MRLFRLIALACLASACADTPSDQFPVSGALTVLQVDEWGKVYRGGRLRIRSINGQAPSWHDATQAALSPGPQLVVLDVLLCPAQSRQCQPLAAVQTQFIAQPGRNYSVRVLEQASGSNVFQAWVVDDTGAIVAPNSTTPTGSATK
ncbi:MAG TPA: hypothetical protein VFA81_08905 [Burkholderiales bacterium]|nr:hypothetical protein [Burkholderiales bacterium]